MTRQPTLGIAALALLAAIGITAYTAMTPRLTPDPAQASAPQPGALQQMTSDPNTGINVSGEGRVPVVPDIARATIGVEITTTDLGDAATQANTKMKAVIDKLKSLGIADKDIQTVNYSVQPITAPPRGPDATSTPAITGYRVANQVRVVIRKLDDLGKILDEALAAGANHVYGVSFGVDDLTPIQQQARTAAIKDAQAKGTQLAQAAGVQLGPVLSISESVSFPRALAAADAFAGGGGEVPIQTGEMQVIVNVQMRFGIR